ncbi:hypothetical protein EGW08_009652, partial [Elysia chlorotica]
PAFDGKKCAGVDSAWDTCVNKTCQSFTDSRAGECAVWDGLQIRYGTHKWQPFQAQEESSQCKQTCQSSYSREVVTIDVHVQDGTPCSYTGNNSNICRDGKCLTVGCDGELNSTKREDMCGVCGGDGSTCKVVEGTLTKRPKSEKEYLAVITLPSGSRNIHVEETSRSDQFFALVDPMYGSFGLGGDAKQSAALQFVYAGAMFEYTRSTGSLNESIVSPGPLKTDVQVMLYANSVMQDASVLFRYSVPQDDFTFEMNKFAWKFKTWSPCSVTCGTGEQTIQHACVDKDSGQETADSSCGFLKAPRQDTVRCTREECGLTSYNYAMSNDFEACDAQCGKEGLQTQKFFCERAEQVSGDYTRVEMEFCAHLPPPSIVRQCRGPPCTGSVTFEWRVSETWSVCPCGENNTQTRNVTCQKVTSTVTSEGKVDTVEEADVMSCEDLPDKPGTSRACSGLPCEPVYRWTVTESYGPCDAACGQTGTQTRELVCLEVNLGERAGQDTHVPQPVPHNLCLDTQKPPEKTRACTGDPCPTPVTYFQWAVSDAWSACPCGEGNTQSRHVTCEKVVSQPEASGGGRTVERADSDSCGHLVERPAGSRPCDGPPCKPIYRWETMKKYGLCNAPCGKTGKQVKRLICKKAVLSKKDGRVTEVTARVHGRFCRKLKRPRAQTRACLGDPCPTTR